MNSMHHVVDNNKSLHALFLVKMSSTTSIITCIYSHKGRKHQRGMFPIQSKCHAMS